jgi:leader peptidase (prepilin peptidase)/N-methyltransferase
MINVFVFAIGLCIGSFLNVLRVRLPLEESFACERSKCRSCNVLIAWYDNIPLVSFMLLRGRCRACRAPISWIYPVMELITGLLILATWCHTRDILPTILYTIGLIAPLVLISFIDLEHMIIPDVISLPAVPIGMIVQLLLARGPWMQTLLDSALGVLAGAGFLAIVAVVYEKLRKQEGLGWGDVKLMAWLGVYFGWQGSIVILLWSSVAGTIIGGLYLLATRQSRKQPIPFGPFIAGSGILYFFYGPQMVAWYLSQFLR